MKDVSSSGSFRQKFKILGKRTCSKWLTQKHHIVLEEIGHIDAAKFGVYWLTSFKVINVLSRSVLASTSFSLFV